MAASSSHLNYDDLRELFDRALEEPNGLRVFAESPGRLINMRQRFHKLRSIERDRSRKLYKADDPKHGVCVWDSISILTSERFVATKDIVYNPDLLPKSEFYLDLLRRQPGVIKTESL